MLKPINSHPYFQTIRTPIKTAWGHSRLKLIAHTVKQRLIYLWADTWSTLSYKTDKSTSDRSQNMNGNSVYVSWEVVYQQLWFHSATRFEIVRVIIDVMVSFHKKACSHDLSFKRKMMKPVLKALYSTLLKKPFDTGNKRPFLQSILHIWVILLICGFLLIHFNWI